ANILGYSELMAQELEENHHPGLDLFRNRIRIVLEETMRARRIVENCLSFARHSSGSHHPIHLQQLLDDTLDLFRSNLKMKGVKIQTACEPQLPTIYGNRGLLQQVIFNLVKNAVDVLSRDGVVWVRARADGNDMVVEVADNGPGIRQEHRNKIFSPFFTTKNEKEGTGLGLSIARTIVEEHGGKLSFDTALGEGTTFTICLPIERRTARRNGPPATTATPQQAADKQPLARVLVVDDDPVMGGLIVDLVQRWYSVQAEVVFSVDAARASLTAGAYKVVFFNVRMNGIDPVSSFDRIKESAGQTAIVTMAGSERPEFVEALLRRGSTVHLRKPFSLNTLLKVLGRLVPAQALM
ncbi:MAG: hybrid sensor histidine kinase/response regulator, partial [Candidatus Wallbacteria bacterium]|nr:hybrid sensor histidine kinase/response regulator [Candidatus Wallbacteria bacterium]